MPYDEPPNHAQQFERAIATAFTCRSIIKYNSTLDEEQKNEILAELDPTLQFLRDRLIVNSTIEANTIIPPLQLAEIIASSAESEDDDEEENSGLDGVHYALSQVIQPLSETQMRNLYKLYHTYLDMQPGKGMNALETRYKIVMKILDDVQADTGHRSSASPGESTEQLIYRVQGFITALYSMFHEFSAVLTSILEGKSITAETDELTSMQKFDAREMRNSKHMLRDITPLMRIYATHLQLEQRKGSVANLVSDATAFLIFLEERLEPGFSKRQEIVEQLRVVAELLCDLSSLLSDYEQAFSTALTL